MTFLLSYTCICTHNWASYKAEMETAKCPACAHFPVFPENEELVGEESAHEDPYAGEMHLEGEQQNDHE